jgi:hypothetical protein
MVIPRQHHLIIMTSRNNTNRNQVSPIRRTRIRMTTQMRVWTRTVPKVIHMTIIIIIIMMMMVHVSILAVRTQVTRIPIPILISKKERPTQALAHSSIEHDDHFIHNVCSVFFESYL